MSTKKRAKVSDLLSVGQWVIGRGHVGHRGVLLAGQVVDVDASGATVKGVAINADRDPDAVHGVAYITWVSHARGARVVSQGEAQAEMARLEGKVEKVLAAWAEERRQRDEEYERRRLADRVLSMIRARVEGLPLERLRALIEEMEGAQLKALREGLPGAEEDER